LSVGSRSVAMRGECSQLTEAMMGEASMGCVQGKEF
jgi:hypothetical protein